MPPATTQVSCPNCRQPLTAEVQQLFDLQQDPADKNRLLSGTVNALRCPHCGYQGNLATPIVYHDPTKELLLTHVPGELGLPRDEQERRTGALINQVVERLPQEQRKGYLLSPQATLTYQGLIERVLEADGVTKEMIEAQKEKVSLLQRLLAASEESRPEIVRQDDKLIDAEFFSLLSQLVEGSLSGGDRTAAERMTVLQEQVLEHSTFGQEVKGQVEEMEAAAQSLRDAGESLTRQKLLDIVLEAPTETRVQALVSLARPGMDYQFFQSLTERIDGAEGEEKERLNSLREQLLGLTREVDAQIEARVAQSRQLLNAILRSHNVVEATAQNLPAIDNYFVQTLNAEIETARDKGDTDRLSQLQQIVAVLEQASQPSAAIAFVQDLLDISGAEARQQALEARADEIDQEFLEVVVGLLNQAQSSGNEPLVDALREIHRAAVRQSMQANLRGT